MKYRSTANIDRNGARFLFLNMCGNISLAPQLNIKVESRLTFCELWNYSQCGLLDSHTRIYCCNCFNQSGAQIKHENKTFVGIFYLPIYGLKSSINYAEPIRSYQGSIVSTRLTLIFKKYIVIGFVI